MFCNWPAKRKIELFFLAILVAAALFIGLNLTGRVVVDDAYITYRYARNLAEGSGFVYNAGDRVLSTTTPLYTLILAASYFLSEDLPRNSHLLSTFSLAGVVILTYAIFAREGMGVVGLISSSFIITNVIGVICTFGMESCLYLLLILISLYFYFENNLRLTALFLGLVVLTRIDGIILVGCVGAHYIIYNLDLLKSRKIVTEIYIPVSLFLLVTVPWFLFSLLYFGQLFPATLKAKMMQYSSGLWPTNFISEFYNIIVDQYLYLLLFFIFGSIYITFRSKKYSLLLFYLTLYCVAFSSFPYYHWYLISPISMFFMISVLGFYHLLLTSHSVIEELPPAKSNLNRSLIFNVIITTLVLTSFLIIPLYHSAENTNTLLKEASGLTDDLSNRMNFYKHIGETLKNETADSAIIGTIEIGIIGWYSEREIVDYCGLLQPFISDNLGDTEKISDKYKVDYLIYSPIFSWVLSSGEMLTNYEVIHTYKVGSEIWFLLSRDHSNQTENQINLIDHLNTSLLKAPYKKIGILEINNISKISLLQHPYQYEQSRISFGNIIIPKNSTLNFSIALDPQVWSQDKGDGVQFDIYISQNETESMIFSAYIDPKNNQDSRRWNDFEIDLSKYANTNVTIIFSTLPGYGNGSNYNYDWAWWGKPIIIYE